jgi:hypothetical protein
VALKIPVDSLEVETLALALELLVSNASARAAMSVAAREYLESQHRLDHVADAYAAAIAEAAVGDTARAPAVAELPGRVRLGV